jgi:hypothetical protein
MKQAGIATSWELAPTAVNFRLVPASGGLTAPFAGGILDTDPEFHTRRQFVNGSTP